MKTPPTYEVCLQFVDSTYWDDGSRWTRRTYPFKKKREAVAFAQRAAAGGCTVIGKEGTLRLHPSEVEISVERISRTEVKWKDAAPAVQVTPNPAGLQAELEELERFDESVARAARVYNETVARIVGKSRSKPGRG